MADHILVAAAAIAEQWRPLATVWHAAAAVFLIESYVFRALQPRSAAVALCLPVLSVAALAWWSRNPFNGTIFGSAAITLLFMATRVGHARWRRPRADTWAGIALCTFGWCYPHFLTGAWWQYLYQAPLGLLPCPTLSFVIGVSLLTPLSAPWGLLMSGLGVVYGAIGVFALGVGIDWILLGGAAWLGFRVASIIRASSHTASLRYGRTI